MHVPDGFLSTKIWLSLDLLSGAGTLLAARRLRLADTARLVPLMGVLSAFVFAAQLLNFPVLGGTSGHLVGGALVGILLGPVAGFLTMVTVLLAQALILQDGGVAALGANLFNIGALPVLSGYLLFRALGRNVRFAGFVAGWTSIMLSAIACAVQLDLSEVVPLSIGLPTMAGYHALIGIAEGALTAGMLVFLSKIRPDILVCPAGSSLRGSDWGWAIGLVVVPCTVLLLGGTSSLPDPLQKLLRTRVTPAESSDKSLLLLSLDRYQGLAWGVVILAACILLALAATWILGARRGRP